jgi:uncharacterized membrane protein (UPF0127 family)
MLMGCGPGLTQGPPQFLPITAQWCLEGPPPARCIQLEVPRGERQYAMGLQLRPPLPHLRGMWFPYDPPAVARFWMHRTPEPLDMLFIAGGRVAALETDVPPCMNLPCRSYGPDTPVDGVLELAAGQAALLGITVGTAVRVTPLPGATPSAPARD